MLPLSLVDRGFTTSQRGRSEVSVERERLIDSEDRALISGVQGLRPW